MDNQLSDDFSTRVNLSRQHFTKTDEAIADFFLNNGFYACQLTIAELAQTIQVSKSAISRFVQVLGYKSLRELRFSFASNASSPIIYFKDFEKDSTQATLQAIFQSSSNSLMKTLSHLDSKQIERAVDLLGKARLCAVFGLGGSYAIAYNAFHRFLRTSLKMLIQPDFHLQMMIAANMSKDDVALIISHSGRNKDMMRIIKIIKEKKTPIILITSNAFSPLAKESDLVFCSISEETKFRPEAVSSMVSQMVIIDTLYTLYIMRIDKDPKRFAFMRSIISSTRLI